MFSDVTMYSQIGLIFHDALEETPEKLKRYASQIHCGCYVQNRMSPGISGSTNISTCFNMSNGIGWMTGTESSMLRDAL